MINKLAPVLLLLLVFGVEVLDSVEFSFSFSADTFRLIAPFVGCFGFSECFIEAEKMLYG